MKALFLFLLISETAFAQSSSRFAITRGVIANGGTAFSSGARFQVAKAAKDAIVGGKK